MTDFLVSIGSWKIQRSIFLANVSAWAKTVLAYSNVVSKLLRQAYTTQPYKRMLVTNPYIIYNLTLTFEMPNNLQFVLTAWNI